MYVYVYTYTHTYQSEKGGEIAVSHGSAQATERQVTHDIDDFEATCVCECLDRLVQFSY